jgi:hypothetical protein
MMFLAGWRLAVMVGRWEPAKKISPMEMGEILHEKIQLYIYKPSINKVTNPLISGVKIPCPYYGEFTE